MRLLANENFPRVAVEALREDGHDVAWIRTERPGATDEQVLAWASEEARVLITLDKDFGELAFRVGLPAACGVVLFRVSPPRPSDVQAVAQRFFAGETELGGEFVVVDAQRVRRRPLPPRR